MSDADRQHVGELLQRAVGDGYITLAEFEERSDAVFTAKTRGELDAVVADIPSTQPGGQRALARSPRYTDPAQVTEIRGTGTGVKRKGPWQVPVALRVRTRLSETVLDFTEAVCPHPVVDIEIDDKMSSTELIVPEQATVDCNALEISWGDLNNHVSSGPPPGRPHIVLHGRVKGGEVKIRHPHQGSWWNKLLG